MKQLRGKRGETLGYLWDMSPHRKAILDKGGKTLGWFDPIQDRTYNFQGLVGTGDLRAQLLVSK
jgi:hypothetical protein